MEKADLSEYIYEGLHLYRMIQRTMTNTNSQTKSRVGVTPKNILTS